MSLNWNVSNIKNYKKLCYVKVDDGFRVSEATDNLIWTTVAVDIGGITEKNAVEFYTRLCEYCAAIGKDPGTFGSFKDVQRHIGLRTNTGPLKPGRSAQWRKKLAVIWRDRIDREMRESGSVTG